MSSKVKTVSFGFDCCLYWWLFAIAIHLHLDNYVLKFSPFSGYIGPTYVYPFVAVLKATYAENVHTVLFCPNKKRSYFNLLCVLICFLER